MRFPCARCSSVPLVPLFSSSIPRRGVLSPHRHHVCFNLPSSLPLKNLMTMSVPPALPRAPTCDKSTRSLVASSQGLSNKGDSWASPIAKAEPSRMPTRAPHGPSVTSVPIEAPQDRSVGASIGKTRQSAYLYRASPDPSDSTLHRIAITLPICRLMHCLTLVS
jgi:hypothetical protein